MPGWLEATVALNPITHLVTAVRGLMSGSAAAGQYDVWVGSFRQGTTARATLHITELAANHP